MKKKVIIIVLIVVLVVGLGTIFYFLKGKSLLEDKPTPLSVEDIQERTNILLLTDFDEIKAKSKELNLDLIISDDNTQIGFEKLALGATSLDVAFQFDKDRQIINVVGGIFPKGNMASAKTDEEKIEILNNNIYDICDAFSILFNTSVAESYNIYANEGYKLNLDDNASYQKLLDGEASFAVFIKDSDESYWKVYSQNYEGELYFSFIRSFDKETQKDWTADIELNK